MKHGNLAFFIPHHGCPHQCSFCNQCTITGHLHAPSSQEVDQAVQQALCHSQERCLEIAFFGGSFTAVDPEYQDALLTVAQRYVQDGRVQGIRISTRPDAISTGILERLKKHGVTAIELGAQSMSDAVLSRNQRGHTAAQVQNAAQMIRAMGFSLGLQMMVGLDCDTPLQTFDTAQKLAELYPDTMRIYPTVVLRGTPLEQRFLAGEYQPMELSEAVELCACLLDVFEAHHIPVIRLGLHDSPQLHHNRLAGPWHPAFRELCDSHRFLLCVLDFFQNQNFAAGQYWIRVPAAWLSRAVGQKRANVAALAALGYQVRFVPDNRADCLVHTASWTWRGPCGILIEMGSVL